MRAQMTKCWGRLRLSPLVAAFILYNAVYFAGLLVEVPVLRLLEQSICNRYYRDVNKSSTDIPSEDKCKVKAVQDLLSTVLALEFTFEAIPGLLTAVFYGDVAQKNGKKVVLYINTVGTIATWAWIVMTCALERVLEVRIVWVSSVFLLLGGGPRVYNAMIYAMVSDSVDHSKRGKYLYLLHAGQQVSRLITPRISAALMQSGIYTPFIVSLSIYASTFLVLGALKEVRPSNESQARPENQYRMVSAEDSPSSPNGLQPDSPTEESSRSGPSNDIEKPRGSNSSIFGLKYSVDSIHLIHYSYWVKLYKVAVDLFSGVTPFFCLVAFFMKTVAVSSEGFIPQYVSERFLWPLSKTTWLKVSEAGGAVVTTMIVCPLLAYLYRRRSYDTHRLDLIVVRVCLFILVASFMLGFFAKISELFILATLGMGLGEGLTPALQGLITHFTDPAKYNSLFAILAQVDTIATLIRGPITSSLLGAGRSESKSIKGWFLLSSSIMFVVLAFWSLLVSSISKR